MVTGVIENGSGEYYAIVFQHFANAAIIQQNSFSLFHPLRLSCITEFKGQFVFDHLLSPSSEI